MLISVQHQPTRITVRLRPVMVLELSVDTFHPMVIGPDAIKSNN